jgi:hypothetical protein
VSTGVLQLPVWQLLKFGEHQDQAQDNVAVLLQFQEIQEAILRNINALVLTTGFVA